MIFSLNHPLNFIAGNGIKLCPPNPASAPASFPSARNPISDAPAQTWALLPGIWKPLQWLFAFRLNRPHAVNLLERSIRGHLKGHNILIIVNPNGGEPRGLILSGPAGVQAQRSPPLCFQSAVVWCHKPLTAFLFLLKLELIFLYLEMKEP